MRTSRRPRGDLEQRLERQKDGGQNRQTYKRRHAAARQHPVVDLQHEHRAGQHQEVDQPAECPDADERTLARPERRAQLGFLVRLSLGFSWLRP